jgi:hypothetical protein
MSKAFEPLLMLGEFYGPDWLVERPGEGKVINRTPVQAARARQEPLPLNLETEKKMFEIQNLETYAPR